MEFGMLGRENEGFFAPRTLSDISIASAASSKVQNTSTGSGQMQLDLSLAATKHMHNRKVKFMCSFGGKILPRPSDRKLRYVGGETRVISVPRYIKYAAFLQKLVEIYGPDILLKYQLPDEDLDALVSVSSDEDLENMLEECDRLDSMEGAPRLRVFIFSMTELDTEDFVDVADPKIAEQRYVDAVNAMPSEPAARRFDDLVLADSSRNSDGLDAYTWNVVQSEVPSLGTFQSEVPSLQKVLHTSNFLVSKTLLSSPDPHSPPWPMFAAAPLDLLPNHRANTVNSNETALAVDDFVDLECAGSASSSASSQHDIHNRYTNSKWLPSAHLQSPQESLPYNGNVEDNVYRIEQRHVEDVIGQSGGLSSRVPLTTAKVALPHSTITKSEDQPDQLQSDSPLSPGAALQKQLQAGRADVLSERFETGTEQPVLSNGYRQQQNFQPREISPDQNPWQRHTFYNPLTNLGLKMTGIGHEDLAKDSSHAPELETCCPDPFTERLQTHQVPVAAVPKDYNSILYSGEGGHISEVPWTRQPIFFEPSDHDVQPLKSFPHELARDATWLATGQTSYRDSNLATELPGEKAHLDYLQCNFRNAPDNYSDGQHHVEQPVLPILLQRTEGLQFPIPALLEEPHASVANYTLATDQVATQHLDRDFNHIAASCAMGDPCTLDMVSQLLQASQLTDNYSEEAVTEGIVTGRTTEFLGGTCDSGMNLNVKAPVESPIASFSVAEPSTHGLGIASRDRGFQPLRESFLSNEDLTALRHQENVLPYSSAFSDIENLSDRQRAQMGGENIPGAMLDADLFSGPMLSIAWETPSVPPPSSTVAAWDSSFSETGYDQQAAALHASGEKEADDMDLTLTVENAAAVEDSSVRNEELDAFESVVDRPTNVAATAAAEAIALGLQTIRNCDLEELRELGSGTFGTVFHGKWRGSDVAIKRIKSSCFSGRPPERERLIADFWREACLLGQLHHPNVVAFYGVVPDGPGGTLATVTEYMVNGSLKQVLQKNDRTLDRRKRLLIAMDAAFGMEYLHGKNVVHFDMKCENLLVNLRDAQRPICKVGDLGLSKVKQQTMVSGGVRGTLPWMAPELLNGSSSLVSEKVDVFSFGIVLWELLTGEEPYANMHYGAIIGGIVNNTLRPPVPRWCDPAWKALMERCWSADPFERPTFTEIAGSLRAMEASLHTKGQGPSTSS